MHKFSANLGLLWTEFSQIDAIYKAKESGFDAVEFQFPYQYEAKEIKKASVIIGLKKHLQQNRKLQKIAKQRNIPIYGINRSSIYQIAKLIQFIML